MVKQIDFFVSTRCSSDCIFCNYTYKIKMFRHSPFSFKEAMAFLIRKRREGFEYVNFTGGEPTELSHFLQLVQYARKAGYRVCVGTNLMKLSDEGFFNEMLPFIDELVASVHAHNEELDYRLTRNPGNFSSLLSVLNKLETCNREIHLMTNTLLTRYNLPYISEIINFILSFKKVKQIILSNISPEGNALKSFQEIQPTLSEIKQGISKIAYLVLQRGVFLRFFGVPACVLGEYKIYSNDLYFSPRIAIERTTRNGHVCSHVLSIDTPVRYRIYTEKCKDCQYGYQNICGGVFKRYYNLYGDNELVPFRD